MIAAGSPGQGVGETRINHFRQDFNPFADKSLIVLKINVSLQIENLLQAFAF